MPMIQVVQDAVRDSKVGWRAIGGLRRAAVVAGAFGLTAGAGLVTAGSALASNGLQPGNLILQPASGAVSLQPIFATTDGCPAGYQGSAQVSMFAPNGTLLSRISVAVPLPIKAFHGTLDGNIGALLKFAGVQPGGESQWAVGCYTLAAGAGNVQWVQYMVVKLSADGKSYSSGAGTGQLASGSGSGSATQSASSSLTKQPTLSNLYGQVASAQYANPGTSSSGGSQLQAGLIAGACGLAVAGAGVFFYRRRNRSRLT
jgi:LPXTG-motif cell wall-anchored protein